MSTFEGELDATSRVTDTTVYCRTVARALGVPCDGPTFVGTDNEAHLKVATHTGSASRARHLLTRYKHVRDHVEDGTIVIGHVRDAENPADHLTKWVTRDKLQRSIEYTSGQRGGISSTPCALRCCGRHSSPRSAS